MSNGDFHFEPVGRNVAVLAASLFSLHLYKELSIGQGFPWPAALAIVLPLAVFVHSLTEFLICRFPMRFRYMRRLVSKAASIEGYWFEGVHSKDHPFSVVCIEFDEAEGLYRYHGINYDADFKRHAEFSSLQTSTLSSGTSLSFHFEATVHRWSGQSQVIGSDAARGYGRIGFTTEGTERFIRGRGEFFETKPQAEWRSFELYKISDDVVRKVLGKTHAEDELDYEKILLATVDFRREKVEKMTKLSSSIEKALPPPQP